MGEKDDIEEWVAAGIQTRLNIVPDHQLEGFQKLSEDSIKLFRISLVVLSIYASAFGFLLNSDGQSVVTLLGNPIIVFSMLIFLISLGGSMAAYRLSRFHWSNGIKTTKYLDLSEKMPPASEEDLNEKDLVYEYYWRRSTDLNDTIKRVQMIVYLSGFSLYAAVIYAPLGLMNFYISFSRWFFLAIICGPIIIPIILSIMISWFWKSDRYVLVPKDELEHKDS